MISENKLLNLFGQIRLYSLADLTLLLIAIKTNSLQFIGVIFLHLGFILFLESIHKHKYRISFPKWLWILLSLIGIVFYSSFSVIGFIIFSFLYAKKNLPKLGPYSPIFRGLQNYFLTAGIIGFLNPLCFIAGGLIAFRNFMGDIRDISKDRKEKLNTLPISLGFKKSISYIYLVALLLTTFVWWNISDVSVIWLLVIYAVEIGTYSLTPR